MVVCQSARSVLFAIGCWLISVAGSDATLAQAWPARTITAIVPFSAGAATDIVARVVLDQVSKQVGRPIVVENRGGAGGTIGANMAAKAAPDGYTLLAHGALQISRMPLYSRLPYDTLRDFVPVIPLALQPPGGGDCAIEGLQDTRRSPRRRQGEARHPEFFLRRRWLRVALCSGASAYQRRPRGPARSLPGPPAEALTEVTGRTSGFFLSPDRAGAPRSSTRVSSSRSRSAHRSGPRPCPGADNDGSRAEPIQRTPFGAACSARADPTRNHSEAS